MTTITTLSKQKADEAIDEEVGTFAVITVGRPQNCTEARSEALDGHINALDYWIEVGEKLGMKVDVSYPSESEDPDELAIAA